MRLSLWWCNYKHTFISNTKLFHGMWNILPYPKYSYHENALEGLGKCCVKQAHVSMKIPSFGVWRFDSGDTDTTAVRLFYHHNEKTHPSNAAYFCQRWYLYTQDISSDKGCFSWVHATYKKNNTCMQGAIAWHNRVKANYSGYIRTMNITLVSYWAEWRLKSPASPLFTQPFIQAQIKET